VGAGIPPSLELFYDFNGEEIPAMGDGSGLAEALIGIDGVRVANGFSAFHGWIVLSSAQSGLPA
jgi:hypothetical protein